MRKIPLEKPQEGFLHRFPGPAPTVEKHSVCCVVMCEIAPVPNAAHACVCVCKSGWVCVRAHVGGAQRPHCDPPLSLKALESGTLSRSETQTIYNSRLVLILSEISISCGRFSLHSSSSPSDWVTLVKLLEMEKPHYVPSVS